MGGIVPMEARAGGQVKLMAVLTCFNVCFPLTMIFLPRMLRLFAYGDITKEELMERTRKMKLTPSKAKKAASSDYLHKGSSGADSQDSGDSSQGSPGKRTSEFSGGHVEKYKASGAFKVSFMPKKRTTVTGPKRVSRASATVKLTELAKMNGKEKKIDERRTSLLAGRARSSSAFSTSFTVIGHDPDDPNFVGFVMYDNLGEAAEQNLEKYSNNTKKIEMKDSKLETVECMGPDDSK